jgi:hypothetical protein
MQNRILKEETVSFRGHRNIRCLHDRTIEITKAASLSTKGDCIAGVSATKGCKDLDKELKARLLEPGRIVRLEIHLSDITFSMHGYTDHRLTLSHDHDIVIRKSNYICPRTLCVLSNKASSDMPRDLVTELQNPATVAKLKIIVD